MPSGDTTQKQLALPLAPEAHAAIPGGDEHLVREQVRLLYDHARLSQLVALLNAGILVFILWPVVAHTSLLVWLGCMVGVCALRLQQSRAFAGALAAARDV